MIIHHYLSLVLLPIACCSILDTLLDEAEFVEKNLGDRSTFTDRYSTSEMIDTAITDIHRTYGIDISDYDDNFVLHKEFLKLNSLPRKVQIRILDGFPSNFKAIPRLIKELKKVEEKELLTLNDEEKEAWAWDLFINYLIRIKPIGKMIRDSLADKEIATMTLAERKKRTKAKGERLMRLWAGDKQILYEEILKGLGIDQEEFERDREIQLSRKLKEENEL